MTQPRLAVVARPEEAPVPPDAAFREAPATEAPVGGLVNFVVPLGAPGRLAVIALPPGITAVEVLQIVQALPEIGSRASLMPTDPEAAATAVARARLVLPR